LARAKSSVLAVKNQRLKLPIAKKPVFESLGDGISIGYRRNQAAGTWIARRADGKGGSWQRVIGTADDYALEDGKTILSWGQAQAKTFEAAKTLGVPEMVTPVTEPLTIAKALDLYDADLQTRGGDVGNAKRLRSHISKKLSERRIASLSAAELRDWRDGLAKKKLAPSSINRTCHAFKAVLNLSADRDESILSRTAWEKGLASLPDANEARNIILTDSEVKMIVDKAYAESQEVGLLVEVAATTGSRYSQIAGLMIDDLQDDRDAPRLMMPSSKKGKGVKKILRRPIPIPATLAGKLRKAAGKRSGDSALLLKPKRAQTVTEKKANKPAPPPESWHKSDHYRPFKRAVEAAFTKEDGKAVKLAGEYQIREVTIYALRHSSIVRQILANVPVRVVAVMHDTSVQMIEKNYSALLADHSDAIARAAILDLGAGKKDKKTRKAS